MRPCTCNVEHYVVRPNIPSYDWKYEYSDGSNANCNCKCNSYLADIVNGMTEIRNTMTNLKESVKEGALTGTTTEKLTQVVNECVIEKLSQLSLTTNKIEQLISASESINDLESRIAALESVASPSKMEELNNKLTIILNKVDSRTGDIEITVEGTVLNIVKK